MKECLMTHYAERTTPVEMIVLHCSAFPIEECLKIWDEYEVSAHYVIDENGEITRLVEEKNKAYHAGEGFWRGRSGNLNTYSIGIELINKSLGQEGYSEKQIEKLIPFLQKLMRKYKLDPRDVVGHSDMAPKRKADPGRSFPWKSLSKEGLGLWYQPKNAVKMSENNVANLLGSIGYDVSDEEAVIASAYAFRRHYLPEEVEIDGDIQHLVDNVYPREDKMQLRGDKFVNTLKAVAYSFEKM